VDPPQSKKLSTPLLGTVKSAGQYIDLKLIENIVHKVNANASTPGTDSITTIDGVARWVDKRVVVILTKPRLSNQENMGRTRKYTS
jgi:hypothetical protein